jgi:hypothetical protein
MKKLLTLLIVFFVQQLYAQTPVVQSLQPTITQQNYSDPTTIHYHVELNGYVNPDGIPCEIYFEYGNTAAYGNIVAASPATLDGSAASTVNFSFEVSHTSTSYNLNNYHCRIRMVTAQGTYYSSNMPFTVNPDPVRWIEIIPTYNNSAAHANFDITNGKNIEGSNGDVNDVINIQYTSLDLNGSLDLTPLVTQHLTNTYKSAIATFYLNGISMFKQVAANNLYSTDDPLPIHNVQVFAQGSVNNGDGQLFRLKNNNSSAITITLLADAFSDEVTIPADGIAEVVTRGSSSLEVDYEDQAYQVVSPCEYIWEGNRWVTVVPISADATTATFELLNNDDITHTMILDNGEGIEHSYTLAANSNQIVTIENYLWDIYLSRSYSLVSEGEYTVGDHFKIGYINPGFAQLYIAPTTSAPTLVTSNSMTLNGKITSTIARDQQVEYYFAYGTDKENLDTQTGTLTATAVDGPGTAVSAAITELTGLTKYYFRLETLNGGVSTIDSITTTVNPNAPVLADIEGAAINYTERQGIVPVTSTITVADADDANIVSAVIRITGNYQIGQDFLLCVDQNGITATWTAATGTLTLTGNVMIANYRTAIRSITFYNTSYTPSTLQRTISITVSDGEFNSNTVTRLINVSSVNNAPVLNDIEDTALEYLAGSGLIPITNTMTVIDYDNVNLASAIIGITNNYLDSEDELTFTNQNGITGVWDSGDGVLTLTGSSTVENYQTALLSVKYNNTNGTPSTLVREVSFLVNDGGGGMGNSNIVTREINISVASSNASPVLASIETDGLTFVEGDSAAAITNTITVSDEDDANIENAYVQITNNYQKEEDTLSFSDQNGITGLWNTENGKLSLSGSSNLANYQTAIRSIKYWNSSVSPNTSTRTIGFTINDGDANSNTLTRQIKILAVNSAPVLTGIEDTSLVYVENDTAKVITKNITANDADDSIIDSAEVRIIGNYIKSEDTLLFVDQNEIKGTWIADSGMIKMKGSSSIENYQIALRSIRYFNTSENPDTSTRKIGFIINDGETNSDTIKRKICIITINDASLLSPAKNGVLYYTEGDSSKVIADTISVGDVDNTNIESALIRISGNYRQKEDELIYTNKNGITGKWEEESGTMILSGTASIADYQTALRSIKYFNTSKNPSTKNRTVIFIVNDGETDSDTSTVTVSITALNSPPILGNIETIPLRYVIKAEGLSITDSLEITDDETYLESASISITANYEKYEDKLLFEKQNGITGSWDKDKGTLTLKGTSTLADYKSAIAGVKYYNSFLTPTETTRRINIVVSDGDTLSNVVSREIIITGQTTAPVLSNVENESIKYKKGDEDVLITNTIKVFDTDNKYLFEGKVSFEKGFIPGEDELKFENQPSITGSYDAELGVIVFKGNATFEEYQKILRTVKYRNTKGIKAETSIKKIIFEVRDGEWLSNKARRYVEVVSPIPTPTNLTIEVNDKWEAVLNWKDNSSNEDGFVIGRVVDNSIKLDSVKANTTSFIDEAVQEGKYYTYGVLAYNNLGVVSDTTNDNINSILIPLKLPTDLKAVAGPEGKIDLSWIDNSSADVVFTVERSDEVNNDFKELHKCKKDSTKHCDKKIKNNCKYYYRVYALKDSLRSDYSNVVEVVGTITEVNEELTGIPKEYKLYTNYPNPFNPSTVIKFDIPKDGKYVLKVYNILGEVVKVLADKEFTAGRHNVTFDATNISSGIYFYQLTGGNQNLIKKMLLIK